MRTLLVLAQHDGRVRAELTLTPGLQGAVIALWQAEARALQAGQLVMNAVTFQRQQAFEHLLQLLGVESRDLPAPVRPRVRPPKIVTEEQRQHKAASRLQAGWRGTVARRRLARAAVGVAALQRIWRAKAHRRQLARARERKLQQVQTGWRRDWKTSSRCCRGK